MSEIVPTSREVVTQRIQQQKVALQKNWRDLARQLNQSVEWYLIDCFQIFFFPSLPLTLSVFRSVAFFCRLFTNFLSTTWKAISIPMQWLMRDWYGTRNNLQLKFLIFLMKNQSLSVALGTCECLCRRRKEKSDFNYDMHTENFIVQFKNSKVSLIKIKSISFRVGCKNSLETPTIHCDWNWLMNIYGRTVAACLGQAQMTEQQSLVVADYFKLNAQECRWLQTVPHRNTLNGTIPSDPLLYRLHEVIQRTTFPIQSMCSQFCGFFLLSLHAIDFPWIWSHLAQYIRYDRR